MKIKPGVIIKTFSVVKHIYLLRPVITMQKQNKIMKPCLNCGKPIDDDNKDEMCERCLNKWVQHFL